MILTLLYSGRFKDAHIRMSKVFPYHSGNHIRMRYAHMFMCTDIHVDNKLMLEIADRDECLYRTDVNENHVKYKHFV